MTTELKAFEAKANRVLASLEHQRNSALNALANTEGEMNGLKEELFTAREEIAELKRKIEELEMDKAAKEGINGLDRDQFPSADFVDEADAGHGPMDAKGSNSFAG